MIIVVYVFVIKNVCGKMFSYVGKKLKRVYDVIFYEIGGE